MQAELVEEGHQRPLILRDIRCGIPVVLQATGWVEQELPGPGQGRVLLPLRRHLPAFSPSLMRSRCRQDTRSPPETTFHTPSSCHGPVPCTWCYLNTFCGPCSASGGDLQGRQASGRLGSAARVPAGGFERDAGLARARWKQVEKAVEEYAMSGLLQM